MATTTAATVVCGALSTRILVHQFSVCVGHSWMEIFLVD